MLLRTAILISNTKIRRVKKTRYLLNHPLLKYMNTENALGYFRNLGCQRYGNEYCVEYRRYMGKNYFFSSSTEAYFNHAVITARRLVLVGLKNEPMHGSGERANGYVFEKNSAYFLVYLMHCAHICALKKKRKYISACALFWSGIARYCTIYYILICIWETFW